MIGNAASRVVGATLGALGLAVCLLPACVGGADSSESVGSVSETLVTGSDLPVPCNSKKKSIWTGNKAELLLADALAQCEPSFPSVKMEESVEDRQDYVVWELAASKLRQILPAATTPTATTFDTTMERWRALREDPTKNCSSDGKLRAAWDHDEYEARGLRQSAPFGGTNGGYLAGAAAADATWGAYALCTAQVLREHLPGSAGFDTLGLSPTEQLDLLGMIKERAQTAMIHNADLINSLIATPDNGDYQLPTIEKRYNFTDTRVPHEASIVYLNDWINRYNTTDGGHSYILRAQPIVGRWGREIAAATELHTIVTQEALDFMSRNRSAGVPRFGTPAAQTPGEQHWGQYSWSARARNFLLAQDKGINQQMLGSWMREAPDRAYAPYVDDRVNSPKIWELFRLAQKLGTLQFLLRWERESWSFQEGDGVFFNIYHLTEVELRKAAGLPTDYFYFSDESSTLLYTRYGITNADAVALIKVMRGIFGQVRDPSQPVSEFSHRQFAMTPVGQANIEVVHSGNTRLVLGPDFRFLPATPSVKGWSLLTNETPDAMWPSASKPGVPDGPGLAEKTDAYINRSHLGAMPALARVRDRLVGAASQLIQTPSTTKAPMLTNADKTISLIDATVGPSGVVFKTGKAGVRSPPSTYGYLTVSAQVRLPVGDPFLAAAEVYMHAVWSDYGLPSLVAGAQVGKQSSLFGETLTSLLPTSHVACKAGRLDGLPEAESGFKHLTCATSVNVYSPVVGSRDGKVALDLVIVAGQSAKNLQSRLNSVAPEEIRLLANDLTVTQNSEAIVAAGGTLGEWLTRFYAKDPVDPALPALDGFGLPNDYVPPFNALALGSATSGPAAPYLLDKAKAAANSATNAVLSAYDKLLQEQVDETTLRTATTKSQQLDVEVLAARCGAASAATCLPDLSPAKPKAVWFALPEDPLPAGGCKKTYSDLKVASDGARENCSIVPSSDTAACNARVKSAWASRKALVGPALRCNLQGVVRGLLNQTVAVHPAVASALDPLCLAESPLMCSKTVPPFSQFAGGTLQLDLQAQYSAFRAANAWLGSLTTAVDAAIAAQNSSETALTIATDQDKKDLRDACDLSDVIAALNKAGGCPGSDCGVVYDSPANSLDTPYSRAWAHLSDAEKENRRARCKAALATQTKANQDAISFAFDNISTFVNRISALPDYQWRIAASGAALQQATLATKQATARSALELALSADSLKTGGIFRRFRAYDLWRAKAQVESARKLATVARRAIEARYVVDLSQMNAVESLVAAPKTWADVIYQTDLSLPISVGGLAPPASSANTIYPNQLADYVGDLDSFVTGYFLERPASPVTSDIDIVSFRGPATSSPVSSSVAAWSASCPAPVAGGAEQWKAVVGNPTLACVDWVACSACNVGDAACAKSKGCIKRPTMLRGDFELDAWGRGMAELSNAAYKRRFNARWSAFAVNLSGTGLVNCALATDPVACRSKTYVSYDLTHGGPAITTNYDGEARRIAAPAGQVEAGKAAFLGRAFDLQKDSLGSPSVAFAVRQEFLERPMGGSYSIYIPVSPELQFEKIELIQFLLGYSYWVKQGQ